jgi:prepilin-type N-terminal cleavage/methylation domain-containing protein
MKILYPLLSSRGVTLIESVVAIALAGVIITAVVAIAVSALSTSTLSKSRTTATRLAEEGQEVARATRDKSNWDDFWATYVGKPAWGIDTNLNLVATSDYTVTIPPCVNPCPFKRKVTIADASTPAGAQNRATVTISVTWVDRSLTQEVKLVSYLTKWFR